MSWSNPTPAVSALRDMLAASSSFTGAGYSSGACHYPNAAISPDQGAADALPLALLAETTARRTRFAESGVAALPGGTLAVTLYADTDAGSIETTARAILADLLAQATGLPITSGEVGLCSDPEAREYADDDSASNQSAHRTITITLTYGLGA
ncbi:MAG: hypothetical protein RLZZ524_926 [Pseudomonadota bacterium]|jgi:hypothetical protein